MRLPVVATILGLCCAVSAVPASQPKGVKPRGDAFDRLSSRFVIRDWISFAKDEYEKLESDQVHLHPRFFFVVSNEGTGGDEGGFVAIPVAEWGLGVEPIPETAFVFVPDPIREAVQADRTGMDLHTLLAVGGMPAFPHNGGMLLGRNQ